MRKDLDPCVKYDTFFNKLLIHCYFYFGITLGLLSPAYGDAVQDMLREAQDARAKASNDYYLGLRKLGPNATKEQMNELKRQILLPAQDKWSKAFQEAAVQREQEIRRTIHESLSHHLPGFAIPKWVLNPMARVGLKGSGQTTDIDLKPQTPSGPINEGPVLDGSNIPKEIEFKGKMIKGKKPAPNASPSSSPEVKVEGEQKFDVIEFSPTKKVTPQLKRR